LFDRSTRWPFDGQWADIFGEEQVIVDGQTTTGTINAIFMVNRLPGMPHRLFFEHWSEVHGPLVAKLPGLRRYTQNHAFLEAFARGGMTHDGWSELWFDDYAAFRRAVDSPEWRAMEADATTLFSPQKGIVIGPEYVQKDEFWRPRDYGVQGMSEEAIRERLSKEGYGALAAQQ
jgi:uncharacterized protein (TIGR02118 family)